MAGTGVSAPVAPNIKGCVLGAVIATAKFVKRNMERASQQLKTVLGLRAYLGGLEDKVIWLETTKKQLETTLKEREEFIIKLEDHLLTVIAEHDSDTEKRLSSLTKENKRLETMCLVLSQSGAERLTRERHTQCDMSISSVSPRLSYEVFDGRKLAAVWMSSVWVEELISTALHRVEVSAERERAESAARAKAEAKAAAKAEAKAAVSARDAALAQEQLRAVGAAIAKSIQFCDVVSYISSEFLQRHGAGGVRGNVPASEHRPALELRLLEAMGSIVRLEAGVGEGVYHVVCHIYLSSKEAGRTPGMRLSEISEHLDRQSFLRIYAKFYKEGLAESRQQNRSAERQKAMKRCKRDTMRYIKAACESAGSELEGPNDDGSGGVDSFGLPRVRVRTGNEFTAWESMFALGERLLCKSQSS